MAVERKKNIMMTDAFLCLRDWHFESYFVMSGMFPIVKGDVDFFTNG